MQIAEMFAVRDALGSAGREILQTPRRTGRRDDTYGCTEPERPMSN